MFSVKVFPPANYPYLAFALIIFLLSIFGDELNPFLLYQREHVAANQWWRLFTCSYVHLGLYHMAMNQVGFFLWQVLFGWRYSIQYWLLLVTSTTVADGVMLHFLSPSLAFYAGFSGVIHGLIAFSALFDSRRAKTNTYIFLGLWLKVFYEHMPLYDVNYLQAHMHAPVIVDAHLYGAIYGSVLALVTLAYQNLVRQHKQRCLGI